MLSEHTNTRRIPRFISDSSPKSFQEVMMGFAKKRFLTQLVSAQGGLKETADFCRWRNWIQKLYETSQCLFIFSAEGLCHVHITMETFRMQSGCVTVQNLRPLRMLMCRLPLITVQPLRDWAASTESMTFSSPSHTLSQRPSQAVQDILETDREWKYTAVNTAPEC